MEKTAAKTVLWIFLGIPGFAAAVAWSGYVLTWLWLWFVVPFEIRAITIPEAIGVSLIFAFFTRGIAREDPFADNTAGVKFCLQMVWGFVSASICLGYGWIIKELFL